jgi:hypothetical protein
MNAATGEAPVTPREMLPKLLFAHAKLFGEDQVPQVCAIGGVVGWARHAGPQDAAHCGTCALVRLTTRCILSELRGEVSSTTLWLAFEITNP